MAGARAGRASVPAVPSKGVPPEGADGAAGPEVALAGERHREAGGGNGGRSPGDARQPGADQAGKREIVNILKGVELYVAKAQYILYPGVRYSALLCSAHPVLLGWVLHTFLIRFYFGQELYIRFYVFFSGLFFCVVFSWFC